MKTQKRIKEKVVSCPKNMVKSASKSTNVDFLVILLV